jgi:aminoglycoside 6'-N-acetyltransferase
MNCGPRSRHTPHKLSVMATGSTVSRLPNAPLRGERTVIRPARTTDVEMLVRWHSDPDVARYWDGKTYTRKQMRARLERPDVDAYVVEADGQPVGYLQAWFGETADVVGLDMFLIPSARGQGIGPDAARTLAGYLLDGGSTLRVTVDPYVSNQRAVAGWKKAGFRPIEEREPDEEHLERWLLMEFHPSPAVRSPAPPPSSFAASSSRRSG